MNALKIRKEAIDIMVETINEFNIELARKNNMPEDQIREHVDATQAQLEYTCGLVYDALKINNYLK